jgi:hypothetical protein
MLPEESRDQAGALYGSLVARASAERGEPWRSCFTPDDMAELAAQTGFSDVRAVRQRDMIPARLWQRTDALEPAELAVLFHGAVPRR